MRSCAEEWKSDRDGVLETACCPFFGRDVEACGGANSRSYAASVHRGSPEAQLKRRIPRWEGVVKYY